MIYETTRNFTFVTPDDIPSGWVNLPRGTRGVYDRKRVRFTITLGRYARYFAPGVGAVYITTVSPLELLAEAADD
jgi:hypothetical protein